MPDIEYHVSSFVVRVRTEDGPSVSTVIQSVAGLEVHVEENGKLIVTAEADTVQGLAKLATVLDQTDKVLSVAPIYHEFSDNLSSATPHPEQPSITVKPR